MKIFLHQKPKFIFSEKLKLFQHILKLPVLELKNYLDEQIEKNPLLEKVEIDVFNKEKKFFDPSIVQIKTKPSLYEHLMFQAREAFSNKEDLKIAKYLIMNLNEKGYLQIELKEIASLLSIPIKNIKDVLKKIQRFDPVGIAAKNLQESILIQLKAKNKTKQLSFYIIKNHFKDLLYRKKFILKKFKIREEKLEEIIRRDYKGLKTDLTAEFSDDIIPHVVVDIVIKYEYKKWKILIKEGYFIKKNEKFFFKIREEEKSIIKKYEKEGLSIIQAIENRKSLLKKIAFFLIHSQKRYFLGEEDIIPYNVSYLSKKLKVHPSTMYRAISNKYVECPRGILPLKSFFSYSKNKEILKEVIEKEKKISSDKELSKKLLSYGIKLSRRTIAKYRKQLLIPSSRMRRKL